jgi:hypothetical protein
MKNWYSRKPERVLAEQFFEKDFPSFEKIIEKDSEGNGIFFIRNESGILLFDQDWIVYNESGLEPVGVIRRGYFEDNYKPEPIV